MADILKHSTNIIHPLARLLPQQKILNAPQRPLLPIIHKMIPRTRIAVQHGGGLEHLPAILLPTPLALERIMRIARRVISELEELAERIEREVALDVLGGVDHTRGQGLLVGLALEDLLFNGAGRDEAVHEAVFLLAVAPYTGQGLLVGGGVPVGVEEDEAVGADEIQTAATGLGRE